MLLRANKLLSTALLLFALSAANAAPTVSRFSTEVCASDASLGIELHDAAVTNVPQVSQTTNYQLAALATEFLKPPANPANSQDPQTCPRSLPPLPRALSLVLTGFLCISLVKDRRFWIAALAGLAWAGQTGIQAIPQLALSFAHRSQGKQQFHPENDYPTFLKNSSRPRSDIEGTQYIGLLRHLAGVPHAEDTFRLAHFSRLIKLPQNHPKLNHKISAYPRKSSYTSLPAIIPEKDNLYFRPEGVVARARQVIFSPSAFILDKLPRGPP